MKADFFVPTNDAELLSTLIDKHGLTKLIWIVMPDITTIEIEGTTDQVQSLFSEPYFQKKGIDK